MCATLRVRVEQYVCYLRTLRAFVAGAPQGIEDDELCGGGRQVWRWVTSTAPYAMNIINI